MEALVSDIRSQQEESAIVIPGQRHPQHSRPEGEQQADLEDPDVQDQEEIGPTKVGGKRVGHVGVLAALVADESPVPPAALFEQPLPRIGGIRVARRIRREDGLVSQLADLDRQVAVLAGTDVPTATALHGLAPKRPQRSRGTLHDPHPGGHLSSQEDGVQVFDTLEEAIETAQVNVRVLANEGHSMTRPLGMLSGVVSSLPEGGDAPILLAKDACEALVDRAHEAIDADLPDLAVSLRGIVRALSPVVARVLGRDLPPVCARVRPCAPGSVR